MTAADDDVAELRLKGATGMASEPRHGDRHLLAIALGVLAISFAIGAALGASRLGLYVPKASSGSFADAGGILANNLEICALLTKPDRREIDVPVRYVGFEIPNRFVIGYGLDFAERYRNLPYVGVLHPDLMPEGT